MPAHRAGESRLYSLKTVCVFLDNPKRGLDAHQGTVTLFDGETGQVRAPMRSEVADTVPYGLQRFLERGPIGSWRWE